MSEAGQLLLEDALASLTRRAANTSDCSDADLSCIAWVLGDHERVKTLAEDASKRLEQERSYQLLATLGFEVHGGGAPEAHRTQLSDGLPWLTGRNPTIAGETAPFVTDAVAILGISLGASVLGDQVRSSAKSWLDSFAPGTSGLPIEDWKRAILSAAHSEIGSSTTSIVDAADIRAALSSRIRCIDAADCSEREILETAREPTASLHPVRAAFRLSALHWATRSAPIADPARLEPEDVIKLLERVPAGLRRWAWDRSPRTRGGKARKWHVDHEYHVQDLLSFLLAPLLPDLKHEEYFPSLGQKQPRTDLFLPSMRLIIEVKFLRASDRPSKVIDEVASDASLYMKEGSDYSGLIAFVWDDSMRTEEHSTLIDGLTEIRGVLGAVVVPRPGRMVDDNTT